MAQKTANENCPVCGIQIHDGKIEFCSQCNWELFIISDDASQGLKNFYSEKLKRHKELFEHKKKFNEISSLKSQQIEKLENQKSELESKNKSLSSDLARQKPLFEKAKKLETESTEKDGLIKKLRDDLKKEKSAHEATKIKNRIKL